MYNGLFAYGAGSTTFENPAEGGFIDPRQSLQSTKFPGLTAT